MSATTGIEWTDATWNPVVGCTKVSQGCKHCYAKQIHDQRHKAFLNGKPCAPQYRLPFETIQLKPERLRLPLGWRAPRKIFVNSVSDLFHDDVPDEYILEVFSVMAQAERHTFQVLTKRPARMLRWFTEYLPDACSGERPAPTWPLPNVWLGVSVENRQTADERIQQLLQTPAAVRFLSCEPLLGPLSLRAVRHDRSNRGYVDALTGQTEFTEVASLPHAAPPLPPIDWVIVGGESGPHARPMHPDWARSLRDQCGAAGVPFFFKQWGEWLPFRDTSPCLRTDGIEYFARVDGREYRGESLRFLNDDGAYTPRTDWAVRVGKKRAGRELDGRIWEEFPEEPR